MLIIDIGCGRKKIAGSVGIDFSPMSNADIVLDLNSGKFPFDDCSVDFAFSSHALEHLTLDGFFNVMREVYRVLKPQAQFKIVVPYFTTVANFANPFHNNNVCFNEHTFRFFSSDSETSALPKDQYQTPSCPQWGLRYSANGELGIEFKTLEIGFFYFPDYRDADECEKYMARSSRMNVVEQITYTLEVVKPAPVRPESGPVSSCDDPHRVVRDQLEYLKKQVSYLDERQSFPDKFEIARQYAQYAIRHGDLYSVMGVLTPANFFIFQLDEAIQRLRNVIDSIRSK